MPKIMPDHDETKIGVMVPTDLHEELKEAAAKNSGLGLGRFVAELARTGLKYERGATPAQKTLELVIEMLSKGVESEIILKMIAIGGDLDA